MYRHAATTWIVLRPWTKFFSTAIVNNLCAESTKCPLNLRRDATSWILRRPLASVVSRLSRENPYPPLARLPVYALEDVALTN